MSEKIFENKVKVEGYQTLLNVYINNLFSRKIIANFKEYKNAKSDVLIEIANSNDIDLDLLNELINHTEKVVDFEEWFNNVK